VKPPIDWLLAGEPFVEYRTRVDLLGSTSADRVVRSAREAMLADSRVQGLVHELAAWPGTVIASHKSSNQPFHKLGFLTELGLDERDPGVEVVIQAILGSRSPEGPFRLPTKVSPSHSGSGQTEWAWALCDAPLLVCSLSRLGLRERPEVRAAVDHLATLVRQNGWPCAVSRELGSFRGPGRTDDPCPFANLAMLKALAEFEDLREGSACHAGAETLLTLWAESRTRHPYMFFMGTDFRKLKAPFVWYDLLHVADVLSRFPWLAGDARLTDMLSVLADKADAEGRFAAESVWMPWAAWEFGQKREPSRWVTLLAWRIINRIEAW
jgi:hypothetical protein